MYFKLALKNVKKSYRDFSVYFITLTFAVAFFYVFNSFEQQRVILQLNEVQGFMFESLSIIMDVISVIVALVFAYLIIYANNFLIRRRKKELATYTLLGMKKSTISKILIYESSVIAFVSLIVGVALGTGLSHIFVLLTAKILSVTVNYGFIFSITALIKTVGIFALLFGVVMIFNSRVLNKYKLIDLLQADRKNDETVVKQTKLSVFVFILGAVLLGIAYKWVLIPGEIVFSLFPIIALGIIGTVLVFKGLAGFMLKFIQSNKSVYYHGLNTFVFRQLSSKINVTYKTMATISILILFGVGTLVTGFNINNVLASQINQSIASDLNVVLKDDSRKFKYDPSSVKEEIITTTYIESNPEIVSQLETLSGGSEVVKVATLQYMSVSDFNKHLKEHGEKGIDLKEGEFSLSTIPYNMNRTTKFLPEMISDGSELKVSNAKLKYKKIGEVSSLITINNDLRNVYLIVNDSELKTLLNNQSIQVSSVMTRHSFELNKDVDSYAFKDKLVHDNNLDENSDLVLSAQEMLDQMSGVELTLAYISIYLGPVFLITCAVILALQQLSEATDNKKRYKVLSDLGVDSKLIKSSVLKQISVYFLIPLSIGLLHSYVGVKAVAGSFTAAYKESIISFAPTVTILVFVLGIYMVYFWITYKGSLAIILED
ncbi:FtsX-like permease family protein [Erysipelothrix sp. HDW6A]|uniref:ABC transporter permease n=1 Tax=Erysipelothrix sp. HDW6A TaxID=2714928 RepID=UPI00140A1BC0|nr:FtsX-like permease family protein [Erysipelothrix sp. HDW6A]QIK57160.1 FtsX-like permease family protein [Erysipelothrix sp. HDW6A]